MKTSYSERDEGYGAAMLTLRTTLGLTRGELANRLCVSRQAVGEWEAGRSYPKAEHLKALIVLAVKSHAFTDGQEIEEIRTLWKAARQKLLLDEHWLSALLDQRRSPHLHIVPSNRGDNVLRLSEDKQLQFGVTPTAPRPRVDWGDALEVSIFYGREEEISHLTQWVIQEHCHVVSVLGMGGIGKSALAVSSMYRLAVGTAACRCPFEVVIFRSLRDAPSCEMLLDDCLRVLSPRPLRTVPANLEERLSLLLEHLRQTRTLIVLDNLEGLLSEGDIKGHLRPGFEGYEQLLRQVAERGHQSCLLLTSREKPTELRLLESRYSSSVRSLRLAGLDITACKQLLEDKEVVGSEQEQEQFIEVYAGNPLALKIVAETIIDLFGGEIGQFLAAGTMVFGSITELLDKQFARLSALEQSVLCWLAIAREPMTLNELRAVQVTPLSRAQMLEAVDSLRRRSLIEPGRFSGSFTLQSVVLEYVTSVLIIEASREIEQRRLDKLIGHGFCQAYTKEYVRQTQERLLLSPLLTALQSIFQRQDEAGQAQADSGRRDDPLRSSVSLRVPTAPVRSPTSTASVEVQLLGLLDQLRGQADSAQGYGPANLIALLRLLRGHLNHLDLSNLSIRGAYLRSVEMQDTKLSRALICDTAFTETVSGIWAVAISPDGRFWASGGARGTVHVWNEGGQTLRLIWQAHTDIVLALAFSPDGRTLASGSRDGTVKLWDMDTGTLLWVGRQTNPISLAFTSDSSLLASGGLDATVRIWESQSGMNLQTLTHPGHVYGVTWSPDGHLLASGCFDGQIRLWERQKTVPTTSVEILQLSTCWVTSPAAGLAFAPDGRTLASANWDRTITLWEVPSGRLLHKDQEQTSQIKRTKRVAWSPDGRTVASGISDQTIWLWDVEQGRYRATQLFHTAQVYDMAFTPDSSRLLSSSANSTLRLWDLASGQCVRVIAGYAVSLYDINWNPDGTQLVSGGSDELVTIWDLRGETPPRVLHNHSWTVTGVGWSPDGRFLASIGWDTAMCLWDPTSLSCIQKFEDRSTLLMSMAWSPDGNLLACGTYLQGMQVWDIPAHRIRWVGQPHQNAFLSVAWSPDGTRLVGAGNDGIVYLWDGTGQAQGTVPTRLTGHQGRVMGVAWSPDGTKLASCSGSGDSGELFMWDMQSVGADRAGLCPVPCADPIPNTTGLDQPFGGPRPSRTFVGHPCVISALAWSPRGDRLVSGDSDGILRWWDVQSGECVSIQGAHQGKIQSIKVSPDGKSLASCGDDGAIMIWDLCSGGQGQTAVPTAPPLLRTLRRDRPYERLNITEIRGLNEAQKTALHDLGAIEDPIV